MFTPDQFIQGTIEQQTVYYAVDDSIPNGEPHYFVVLNVDPKTDQVVYMACATSKVREAVLRRSSLPVETVVVVRPADCPLLKMDSAFDCNNLFERTVLQLTEKRTLGKLQFKGKMPDDVFGKLIDGVLKSPLVTGRVKKLIKR